MPKKYPFGAKIPVLQGFQTGRSMSDTHSLIDFEITKSPKTLGNLRGIAFEEAILCAFEKSPRGVCVIFRDNSELSRAADNLRALDPRADIRIFSDYETLPYDAITPHQDIISSRLRFLSSIKDEVKPLVLTTLPAVMQRLPPVSWIGMNSFALKAGDRRDLMGLRHSLAEQGYTQTEKVLEHGEFAVRGEILDIFPMGSQDPFRIDFFDDEVESIQVFDLSTQRSQGKIPGISLLPAHEFPLDEEGIAAFRSNYRNRFLAGSLSAHIIYQSISKGAVPAGIEYYLPLFFAQMSDLFEYLNDQMQVLTTSDFDLQAQRFEEEANRRSSQLQGNPDHPPLPVTTVFLGADEASGRIKKREHARLSREKLGEEETARRGVTNARVSPIGGVVFAQKEKGGTGDFARFVQDLVSRGGRVLLSAITEGRRQALREILPEDLTERLGIVPASSFSAFLGDRAPLMLTISPFYEGCLFEGAKVAVITETELYGQQVVRARQRARRTISQDELIQNLAQLQPGQVVVHIDHGIGLYRGIKVMVINGISGEYVQIEYKDGDMLSIPITSLNKIARYSGAENPPLTKLGSNTWNKKKERAVHKARDVAAELLDLYARRSARGGHGFAVDRRALDEFATGFSYEETDDQKKAIEATLADMEAQRPMDRLICGDVGFGKTEVAMRAAFVAASDGTQVAMLVPTTILAEQHFQNFRERFAFTPLRVEVLSRFRTKKEQQELAADLREGRIDIIIGTHKLLSPEVRFRNLGLVIIDEEHRFGVRQKERLKELRSEVDLLTLTATPIPRTLNMSLEGMRELSIIATPPQNRIAIKTFVLEDSAQTCREAVIREIRRGGQIYYLHNDLSTISQRLEQLQKLVPEAKIEIGHGQMPERELQRVMRDFTHQRFNLLLCSTIIENGLDVPTANTIIIDRADLLGLAQLHQIRGRVGRSHHQAYAYLFTPPKNLISRDARLRLEAIAMHEELGVGFSLATHDLEIRGAGELLGEDQSGQIEQVGFSLYMQMLNAAIRALKSGKEPSLHEISLNECEIDLHLPSLFPDTYIHDIATRLSLYKRLASCESREDYEDLKVELIDRFGLLPESAQNLFAISRLRHIATALGISRIAGNEEGGVIEFGEGHKVDPDYLISLIAKSRHGEYRLLRDNSLRYALKESEKHSRLELMDMLLRAFAAHSGQKEILSL